MDELHGGEFQSGEQLPDNGNKTPEINDAPAQLLVPPSDNRSYFDIAENQHLTAKELESRENNTEYGSNLDEEIAALLEMTEIFKDRLPSRSDLGAALSDLWLRIALKYRGSDGLSTSLREKFFGKNSLEQALRMTIKAPANQMDAEIAIRKSGIIGEFGVRSAFAELGMDTYFARMTREQFAKINPAQVAADTREKNDMWMTCDLARIFRHLGINLPGSQSDQDTFLTQVKGLPIDPRGPIQWVARPIRNKEDVMQATDEIFRVENWASPITPEDLDERRKKFLFQMLGDPIDQVKRRTGFLDAIQHYESKYYNVGGMLIVIPSPTAGERRQTMINAFNGTLMQSPAILGSSREQRMKSPIQQLPMLSQKLLNDITSHYFHPKKPQTTQEAA